MPRLILRKNFTLIELLIVIAIIAVLLSMLLPHMLRSKQVAERAVCASNLRQMGTAMSLYVKNNSGFYPSQNARGWDGWAGMTGSRGPRRNTRASRRALNPYLGIDDDTQESLVTTCTDSSMQGTYESRGTSYVGNITDFKRSINLNKARPVSYRGILLLPISRINR